MVARLDAAGDVVLAGPAVRAIAARARSVTMLVSGAGAQAAAQLPGVDAVVTVTAPWIDPQPGPISRSDVLALADAIAGADADEAVILTSWHQSALPTALAMRMAGVPRITAYSEDYPGSLLDVRVAPPDGVHEVTRNLALAGAAGFPQPTGDDGLLRLTGVGRPSRDPRRVVLHPGTAAPARAWPATRFAALGRALAREGLRVVVTGSDAEAGLTRYVADACGGVDLGGRTDLAGLARVMAGAAATAVANTGPAHVAAAVGTPVAWVHAPTVPAAAWHPWGVRHEVLSAPVPCAGCHARHCPHAGHPCMAAITVDAVTAAMRRLIR